MVHRDTHPKSDTAIASSSARVRPTGCAVTYDQTRSPAGLLHGTLACCVGTVESIESTAPVHLGMKNTRVVVPMSLACETCAICTSGLSDHCMSRTRLSEMLGSGACVEVPIRSLIGVPNHLPDAHAGLAHLVGRALRVVTELPVGRDAFVSIVGSCARTVLCAQAMRLTNEYTRVVTLNHPASAAVAQVCDQLSIKHRPGIETGRRSDQHAVIECSGTNEGFVIACKLAHPRATVILASGQHTEPLDLSITHTKELRIVSARCGSVARGVVELSRDTIVLAPIVTVSAPFERAPSVLDDIASGACLAAYLTI